ncbi:MAG: chromate transporter [Firmicutes bacterium]|jgi:chromate transporter|nr:chromate transporter [Bacillota bacterium]
MQAARSSTRPKVAPTPFRLFKTFLAIGAFTFGGGYVMLPLIKRSIVEHSGWIGEDEFVDAIAIAQSSPGPIAVNIATLTGYKLGGYTGAFFAVLGASLPSFLIILMVASVFLGIENNPYVRAAMTGMRPAIVALMASAVYDIGKSAIKNRFAALLALLATVALIGFNVHPVLVLTIAAAVGLIKSRFAAE